MAWMKCLKFIQADLGTAGDYLKNKRQQCGPDRCWFFVSIWIFHSNPFRWMVSRFQFMNRRISTHCLSNGWWMRITYRWKWKFHIRDVLYMLMYGKYRWDVWRFICSIQILIKSNDYDRSITHQFMAVIGKTGWLGNHAGYWRYSDPEKTGYQKQIYHCNEGHAALINVQRLVDLIRDEHLTFQPGNWSGSCQFSLYGSHLYLPVDSFDEACLARYMSEYPAKLQISWGDLWIWDAKILATITRNSTWVYSPAIPTREVNGVSWLHGEVSKNVCPIWKVISPKITCKATSTNGVHLPSWTSSEWKGSLWKILH